MNTSDRAAIKAFIDDYSSALTHLVSEAPQYSEAGILAVLSARNHVRAALADHESQPPVELLSRLLSLDAQLREQAPLIAQQVDLEDWRDSFEPAETAWWWRFPRPPHPRDRLDWLWSALTIACLTACLSLLAEIASRFIEGGPDLFGVFMILGPSVMTLLAGGGALTQAGREWIESILTRLGLPKYWWHETKFLLAFLLLILLIVMYTFLPQIGKWYDEIAFQAWKNGDFSSSEVNYDRSLALNPDDPRTHFHLGLLSQDMGNLDAAISQFQLAVEGGFGAAYAPLARLYITTGRPEQTIQLLLPQENLITDSQTEPELQYAIALHLGWARLKQNRVAEAIPYLQQAVQIGEATAIEGRGLGHCLFAVALENQGNPEAQGQWQNCLALGSPIASPEEDELIGFAKQRVAIPR